MNNDRKKVLVDHGSFDWGRIDGETLARAGKYLLDLAKTLPADAFLDDITHSYDIIAIRVASWRDETDEEYTARKESEALAAKRAAEKQKRDEDRRQKHAAYEKLKRELGYR